MLSCIYQGKYFDHDEPGYTEIEKRLLGKEKEFLCPICLQPVYYNSKGKIDSHFSHYPGTACEELQLRSHDVHNEIHDGAKGVFVKWIQDQYPDAVLVKDRYLPEIKQLTDVFIELGEVRIALELQIKHIPPEILMERHEKYKESNIKDIWIFIRQDGIHPGSPYEREYYRRNGRELYYYDIASERFTYYKGVKAEYFNTVGVGMKHFITRTCYLDDVGLECDGRLELPGWREAYIHKLGELRAVNHVRIRKHRQFVQEIHERHGYKMNYKQTHVEIEQDTQRFLDGLRNKEMRKQTTAPAKHAANTTMHTYDSIDIEERNGKKIALIHYNCLNTWEYEIISMQATEDLLYMICKSCKPMGGEKKGYLLKAYPKEQYLEMEEWFT